MVTIPGHSILKIIKQNGFSFLFFLIMHHNYLPALGEGRAVNNMFV